MIIVTEPTAPISTFFIVLPSLLTSCFKLGLDLTD